MTSLHQAARSQFWLQRVIDAYRAGESLDEVDDDGQTPLHHALDAVVSTVVTPTPLYTLVALGADPDPADRRGVRPLHLACRGAKVDAARLLLRAGADPRLADIEGRAPMDELGTAGLDFHQTTIARWLEGEPLPENEARLPAAAASDAARAAWLLREGADPNGRDGHRRTALHAVASTSILAAALALGADPNAKDRDGRTPLHIACEGLGSAIRLLIANGADPSIRDAKGRLPVDGLRAQSYAGDFYDGFRLEGERDVLIRLLSE